MKTISIGTTLRITDPRVFRAQLELLYRLTARSHAAAFTLSTAFLVVLLYEGSRNALATSWWLLLNGVGFARIWLGTRLRAGEMLGWTLKQWAVVTVLGAWLSGVNWGVFLLFLSPPWGAPDYPVTVFMAAGIPAVSLLANSAILASNVGIVFPILVPYALQLMWNAASRYETLTGVAAMIYGAVFLGLGRVVNRSIVEAFRLRFRNDDLVQSLSASNTDLAGEVMAREAFEVGLREARASAEAANAAKSQFLAKNPNCLGWLFGGSNQDRKSVV